MKKPCLIFIILTFIVIPSFSQTYYIDYKIRTDDFYADVSDEAFEFNEEIVWKIKYKMGSSGSYSSLLTYENNYDCNDPGAWWYRDVDEIWTGTCLTSEDDLYIFLEAWEEDGGNTTYGTGDDDYRSDEDYDTNIASNSRNTWVNFNSNDNSGDYVNAGTVGATNGDYRVEIDVWWNYTIPVVSCALMNVSYGSMDISMSSGNYRVTSWEYEVSDDASFSNIVANGSTSNSSATATGLAPLTEYWVRIKGTNEGGTGNYSSTQTATTTDAVTEPIGDGTEGNPYQIANITHLNWLVQNTSAWGSCFIQTSNIDGTGTSGWNDGKGISNIGNTTIEFTGVYDGGSYVIDGLSNSGSSAYGLFRQVSGAIIKNIGVTNANYIGSSSSGVLVGKATNESQIINCFSSGSIDGHQSVGGLVGSLSGNSSVTNSYSLANANGTTSIGGLVGFAYYASVSNSYARGSAYGDSESSDYTGGLIGFMHNYSTIINCYSTGAVDAVAGNIGGLVGVGLSSAQAYNCFWDKETSGQSSSSRGTGKTTSEMKTQSTFTNAGWDFNTPIWSIDGGTNDSYPNLENNTLYHLWTGNTDSDWNTASNWNLGVVPTSNDNVYISQAQNNPVVGSAESADCNNLTLNSGSTLTIASGGSIIPAGTISNNGTFNVEHSMSDGEWHFISSPVEGATANIFYGDYLQYYDETLSENNYVDIENENMSLSSCKGFAWRNYNKNDFTFTGNPHHGNQSITTTADNTWGWNLVGNPYPSSIDWDLLDDTYNTIYIWTGTSTEFSTYNDGGGTNGGTNEIAPMQGFLISTSTPGTFAVNNSHRIHIGSDGYVKSKSELRNFTKLRLSSDDKTDEVFIQFREDCSDDYDSKDGLKIKTTNPDNINIYTKGYDVDFSIDRRPESENIQLGIKALKDREMLISIVESDFSYSVLLEDTKLNIFHDFNRGAYEFNWNTADSEERFILHLSATGTEDMEAQDVQVYKAGGQVYVRLDQPEDYQEIVFYDMAGRLLQSSLINKKSVQRFDFQTYKGALLVQVKGKLKIRAKKIVL